MKNLFLSLICIVGYNTVLSQTPGAIYQACTTVGNPLDSLGDGYITASGSAFSPAITDEIEEFEGSNWNVVWHQETEPTNDLQTGATCGATELVDNPNTGQHAAYYRLVDPDTDPSNRNEQLVIRMRVATNPTGAYGYSMLIDTDQAIGSGVDGNAVSGNPGFELEIIFGSGGGDAGVRLLNVDGTTSGSELSNHGPLERNQRAYALHSNCTTSANPVFLDFYVELADFPIGITAETTLRLVFASSSSPSSALGGSASDIGGVDDTNYPNDDAAFVALVNNTPTSTFSEGLASVVDCNDVSACNYDAAATGSVDCTYATTWYADSDSDGAGDPSDSLSACTQPLGYVAVAGDACPTDVNKTAAGVCGCGNVDVDVDSDGVCDTSDNCTDTSACNYNDAGNAACTFATTWYEDADSDGVGDPNSTLVQCSAPTGYVAGPGDLCPSDPAKLAAGTCGCGVPDADVDGDSIVDCNDNCTDTSACNYNDAGNAACTFATTWYADSDSDGAGDPSDSLSACTQPSGYVAVAGDACPTDVNKTAAGVCGCGNVDVDVDSDGVCDTSDNCTDTSACNYNDAGNAACTFATTWYADSDSDGAGDPSDSLSACTQPSGYVAVAGDACPTDVNKTAAGVCGCGNVDADTDGDTVMDCNDNCIDTAANNFNDASNAPCTYDSAISSTVLASVQSVCEDDSVVVDLDTLHTLGAGFTYSIMSNLLTTGTGTLNGTVLSLGLDNGIEGKDTITLTLSGGSLHMLKLPIAEWNNPVQVDPWTVDPASSPVAADGAIFATFNYDYGSPIQLHLDHGGLLSLINGVAATFQNRYTITHVSNVKGCTAPASVYSVSGALSIGVPCTSCNN